MIRRNKKIQAIVEKLLEDSMIPIPPVNVEKIAKSKSIQIKKEDLKDISGLIYQSGNQVIIGVNETHHENRQRFTIAHELGHFFLHSQSSLFIDKVIGMKLRNHTSSEAVSVEEIEANAFAAELLMPTKMLIKDLAKFPKVLEHDEEQLDTILDQLSKQYKVSRQAMTVRLSNLGFFQEL